MAVERRGYGGEASAVLKLRQVTICSPELAALTFGKDRQHTTIPDPSLEDPSLEASADVHLPMPHKGAFGMGAPGLAMQLC